MKNLKKLILSALLLAIALLLPFLTGQIPQIGRMLSPMHIPVLLCGFICGWPYALAVGLIAPLMRHLIFGMPPLMTAICMTFELAAYGLLSGLLYKAFPKKTVYIYVSLILAMLGGRIVWGVAAYLIYPLFTKVLTWEMFLSAAFVGALPGIILHILLIPVIVIALKKAHLMDDEK